MHAYLHIFAFQSLQYDICDKFPDNFRGNGKPGPWFNTVGSNYGCSSDKCCLWFPPTRCANIPTIKYRFLPFTDRTSGQQINDCNDQATVEANAITAAEVWEGHQVSLLQHYSKIEHILQHYY